MMNHGMNPPTQSGRSAKERAFTISDIVGSKPVLPGESYAQYRAARASIFAELEAKGPIQQYLAEKILDCLLWMNRYEEQKRLTIADAMAQHVSARFTGKPPEERLAGFRELILNNVDHPEFRKLLQDQNLTIEFVRERAMSVHREELLHFDRLIAMHAKNLESFQRSYEHVTHRTLHAERLALSLELLRRDVQAIEVKANNAKARESKVIENAEGI